VLSRRRCPCALTRWLQNIGEAASKVSPALRAANPEVQWARIVGMGHRVVHDYFYVDLSTAWAACQQAVPDLVPRIEAILKQLPDDSPG
jgi:uncharacterized protein with HEPN domain